MAFAEAPLPYHSAHGRAKSSYAINENNSTQSGKNYGFALTQVPFCLPDDLSAIEIISDSSLNVFLFSTLDL